MILYNVTSNIGPDHEQWLQWMQRKKHIPEIPSNWQILLAPN
jgi:hypothetical protein